MLKNRYAHKIKFIQKNTQETKHVLKVTVSCYIRIKRKKYAIQRIKHVIKILIS